MPPVRKRLWIRLECRNRKEDMSISRKSRIKDWEEEREQVYTKYRSSIVTVKLTRTFHIVQCIHTYR